MAYGVEVYRANGNTVLSYTSRVPRFVQSGTFVLRGANTTNTTVTGMANNDSWNVFLVPNTASISLKMQVALFTDFFSTRMPSNSGNNLVSYWVLRS
jgi:hypothetical protein